MMQSTEGLPIDADKAVLAISASEVEAIGTTYIRTFQRSSLLLANTTRAVMTGVLHKSVLLHHSRLFICGILGAVVNAVHMDPFPG